jgi:hypothetical protein
VAINHESLPHIMTQDQSQQPYSNN